MQYRYTGGIQDVSVVFADRVLDVHTGDVVDLTDDEAALMDPHPDWQPADAAPAAPIDELRKGQLVELAAQAGLDTTGTRADLIARLTADETPNPTTTGDPAASQEA
jgi:hypothetical protein